MTQIIYPRPIGGGPRPGGSSGAAGAITYPAERPRLVELQIDAGAFGLLIMNRIRAETICAGQEFQLSKDGPVYAFTLKWTRDSRRSESSRTSRTRGFSNA